MRKDTRFWITLPASLSLAVSAALVPALVQANESQSEDESSWQSESASPTSSEDMGSQSSDALSQLAEQESDISEFVKAVEKAGMTEALTSGTQYTIFAPTNDALESDSKLKELMESQDPQDRQELVNLLRSHIVADDVDAEMAKKIGKAKTVSGGEIELTAEGDKLMVGGNEVLTADIQQGNLRVHAIDGVLDTTGSPTMASTGESGTDASSSMAAADFDELDQNADGYLDEQELQNAQSISEQQSQLDQDQDGRLSRTEFAAFEEMQSDMPSADDQQSTTDTESDWPSDEQ
ncbi:MAG TPA: fasciclin domain-containing protein [Pseudomonadales bacterium]